MTICLASCLPAFLLHSQTLLQTSGWILHANSLFSTTRGLNGILVKKNEISVESEQQSTARPHQSTEFALESAAFHIKVTPPLLLIPIAAMVIWENVNSAMNLIAHYLSMSSFTGIFPISLAILTQIYTYQKYTRSA